MGKDGLLHKITRSIFAPDLLGGGSPPPGVVAGTPDVLSRGGGNPFGGAVGTFQPLLSRVPPPPEPLAFDPGGGGRARL